MTDTQSASVTFPRPTTTAEDSNAVVSVCGATTYTVHNDQADGSFSYDVNWAKIDTSTDPITFTIDTAADTSLIDSEASKTITVYLKASLDDYTSYTRETYTQIDILINAASCICDALAWDDPSGSIDVGQIAVATPSTQTLVVAEPNTAARSSNAAFDKCYLDGGDCSTAGGSYSSLQISDGSTTSSLPGWVSFTSSGV